MEEVYIKTFYVIIFLLVICLWYVLRRFKRSRDWKRLCRKLGWVDLGNSERKDRFPTFFCLPFSSAITIKSPSYLTRKAIEEHKEELGRFFCKEETGIVGVYPTSSGHKILTNITNRVPWISRWKWLEWQHYGKKGKLVLGRKGDGIFHIDTLQNIFILVCASAESGKSFLLQWLHKKWKDLYPHGNSYLFLLNGSGDFDETLFTDTGHTIEWLVEAKKMIEEECIRRLAVLKELNLTHYKDVEGAQPILFIIDESQALWIKGLEKKHKEEIEQIRSWLNLLSQTYRKCWLTVVLAGAEGRTTITGVVSTSATAKISAGLPNTSYCDSFCGDQIHASLVTKMKKQRGLFYFQEPKEDPVGSFVRVSHWQDKKKARIRRAK